MSYEVQNFTVQVIERSKHVPVLVDFWAPWCSPCRALGPVLESLAAQAAGRWELVKVNTEANQDLASDFNIASIPAVKLFVDGKVVDEFVGVLPERAIRSFLDKAIPSQSAKDLSEARRLLSEGSMSTAQGILEPIVESEPGNAEARVLLAQALLSSDPQRIPGILDQIGPDSDFADKADALRTLSRISQLPSRPGELPEGAVREGYLAGAAAVRAGDFGAALQTFIEVLERNKSYDDGGAKKACKAIFQLLGPRHPIAERFFRAFSSALHS